MTRVRGFLLFLLLALSAGIASGQPATDPLESCAGEKDDAARLACFDRQMALRHGKRAPSTQSGATAPVQAAPPPTAQSRPPTDQGHAASSQPPVTAPAPPAAAQSARAPDPDMGLQGAALRKKLKEEGKERPRPVPVSATVTRLVPLAHAEYGFQLDNGQIWQQTDGRGDLSLKVNDPVTISPGSFGDFFFTTPTKTRIRVKRVR
jgi:hypothetical protein